MNRLNRRLTASKNAGRKVLNAFVTAGDPQRAITVPAMRALVRGGADLIELGVPFSDPEADGPAIQAASERALANGVTLADVLAITAEFRTLDADTPVVFMGYLNTFLKMGLATFCAKAASAGLDGVIVVNMPPEESGEFKARLAEHGIALVFLVAPTTTAERAAYIASHGTGFIYYVSYKGVTGAKAADANAIGARLVELRRHIPALPLLVGFGIRDGASAARIAPHADGVVVGTTFVNTMAEGDPAAIPSRLADQVGEIRRALDAL